MSKLDETNKNPKNKKLLKQQLIPQNIRCLICKKRIKNYRNLKNKIIDKKENIKNKENNEENINKEKESENPNFINIFCNKCKDKEAIYECLNCDLILCLDCKSNHQLDPNFQAHKIISYELNPNIAFSQCPFHKLNYKYFCLDDNTPLCFKCAESLHQNHNIKLIIEINDYYLENIEKEIKKGNNNINNLKELINSLNELKIRLEKEKNIIIRKLLKNFKDINNIILTQNNIINNQINIFFNKKIELKIKK